MNKFEQEIESFQEIWHGGYKTGYKPKRNQKGIEKYLSKHLDGKTFLEIGCGGGQWSKFIYQLDIYDKMFCIDVLSEKHNKFWDNLGYSSKQTISYNQVKDFNLNFLKDDSIDFVFSYDVFCHISKSGLEKYLESLSKKCKKEAKLMIMYADPNKYLNSEPENRFHVMRYLPKQKFSYKFINSKLINDALDDSDGDPSPGRWYWVGLSLFLELCEKYDFRIIENDLNIDKTNPITLFQKK